VALFGRTNRRLQVHRRLGGILRSKTNWRRRKVSSQRAGHAENALRLRAYGCAPFAHNLAVVLLRQPSWPKPKPWPAKRWRYFPPPPVVLLLENAQGPPMNLQPHDLCGRTAPPVCPGPGGSICSASGSRPWPSSTKPDHETRRRVGCLPGPEYFLHISTPSRQYFFGLLQVAQVVQGIAEAADRIRDDLTFSPGFVRASCSFGEPSFPFLDKVQARDTCGST